MEAANLGQESGGLAALDCSLTKCLVLCARLRSDGLVSDEESDKVKRFLLAESDPAKLSFLVRGYESSQCMKKFRDNVAGFMGMPNLGKRDSRSRNLSPGSLGRSHSFISASDIRQRSIDSGRVHSCSKPPRSPRAAVRNSPVRKNSQKLTFAIRLAQILPSSSSNQSLPSPLPRKFSFLKESEDQYLVTEIWSAK